MDVLVDINKINDTKKVYKNYSDELEKMISNLKKSVDSIKTQWKGASKDSFENSHFPKLYESMKEHNKRIETLAKELEFVSKEFTALEKEIINKTK